MFSGSTEKRAIKYILWENEDKLNSWDATEETLLKLEQCVNRPSEVKDDEDWTTTTNDFVKAAFKDLSVLKDSAAMDLFDRLAKTCLPTYRNGEDMFVWAKTVKERPDGSAVIVLHVSDLERFRRIVEEHELTVRECDSLEQCVQFGS